MENAAKASFGNTSSELRKQKEEQELEKFNSQFLSYEGKDGITIYDVVTVANIATENNKYYELTGMRPITNNWNDYYIAVVLRGSSIQNKDPTDYNNLIKDYLTNRMRTLTDDSDEEYLALQEFTCRVEINDITGRVYKVFFEPIP